MDSLFLLVIVVNVAIVAVGGLLVKVVPGSKT
jgi:hypothetical protein